MVKVDQFWIDVSEAHDKIAANNDLEITVARGGQEAKLKAVSFSEDEHAAIVIVITSKPTETREAFIVPAGT